MPRAKKTKPEPTIEQVADDAIASILSGHSVPTVSGPIEVDGHWIEEPMDANVKRAEKLVEELVEEQDKKEKTEHGIIVAMFESVARGDATSDEFAAYYGEMTKDRNWSKATKASRKSNLRGVIAASTQSPEFVKAVREQPMGLQAAYMLWRGMLKLAAPADTVTDSGETEPTDDDAPSMSPHDLVLHQINNAIDAAANAGYDDTAEQLRAVFYSVRDKQPAESLL